MHVLDLTYDTKKKKQEQLRLDVRRWVRKAAGAG
jgi:hypothetical protein